MRPDLVVPGENEENFAAARDTRQVYAHQGNKLYFLVVGRKDVPASATMC